MLETILKRRSVRKFDGRQVPREVVDKILEATMTAPSSKNVRSTRIAVSTSKDVARNVAEMRSTGTAFVSEAPLLFFIMGDSSASDLWRINSSISATVLQLAVEDLGLGSCWVHVDGRPHNEDEPKGMTAQEWLREKVDGLPREFEILCVVAVGYPAEPQRERKKTDDSDKIFFI